MLHSTSGKYGTSLMKLKQLIITESKNIAKEKYNIDSYAVVSNNASAMVKMATCYKKVIAETTQMQESIQNELKLTPVEKEVVVLYAGEKDQYPNEYWEGKRVVEMDKPRPAWFSKNLLQQTTQQPATTTDVKPSDLA
ncbi:hypothetical protein FQA39_LY09722 [Lamprigera yunnana]|nr:hypothetical protein FQA39_LY09722 [Lamprigera yunnana]